MKPPKRPSSATGNQAARKESLMMTMLRYLLGIGVLAAMFTVAHLLLWNPNDTAQTAEQQQIDDMHAEPEEY